MIEMNKGICPTENQNNFFQSDSVTIGITLFKMHYPIFLAILLSFQIETPRNYQYYNLTKLHRGNLSLKIFLKVFIYSFYGEHKKFNHQ